MSIESGLLKSIAKSLEMISNPVITIQEGKRKIIQIDNGRYLCDDGTVWREDYDYNSTDEQGAFSFKEWKRFPGIPQHEDK